jgi:hypothetical protein
MSSMGMCPQVPHCLPPVRERRLRLGPQNGSSRNTPYPLRRTNEPRSETSRSARTAIAEEARARKPRLSAARCCRAEHNGFGMSSPAALNGTRRSTLGGPGLAWSPMCRRGRRCPGWRISGRSLRDSGPVVGGNRLPPSDGPGPMPLIRHFPLWLSPEWPRPRPDASAEKLDETTSLRQIAGTP